MIKQEDAIQLLQQQRILPLYYHDSVTVSMGILKSLYEGGIRMVEYTCRGENALANFIQLKKMAATDMQDLQLGIGTIKNKQQAQQFIDAGADFVVCPTMNKEVAGVVQPTGRLWIPGCMTPTEISMAEEAGATVVKVFPGHLLGPSYIAAVKELFPNILFMPTGGVEAEATNLKAWFNAGVIAVGMGSKLITKELVAQQDYAQLKKAAESALQLVKNVTPQ